MSFLNAQKEFDSPEAALAHFGVKGMKWGVRKSGPPSTRAATAKKVGKTAAKGVGYATVLAGSAFVAHQLVKSGSTPVSSINPAHVDAAVKATQAAFLASVKPELIPR